MSSACFARGLRPAGPDDSSAWLLASITVSRSIWRRQFTRLPSLVRWFTSPLGHPRLRVASRRSSLVDSPLSSGDRQLVVFAAPRHQREDDARDLVGQRHRRQLELVFDRLALEQRRGPNPQGVIVTPAMAERGAGPDDQQLA